MPPRTGLGELEQLILLAVVADGGEPSGLEISRALAERAGRRVSKGALYATLQRLRDKGLLSASTGSSDDDPYPRRHFVATAEGLEALRRSTRGIAALLSDAAGALNR